MLFYIILWAFLGFPCSSKCDTLSTLANHEECSNYD
jgi:hypothetical protein